MKIIVIAALAALAGCATVGREVSKDQIGALHKGETTTTQAATLLGQPTTVSTLGDGRQIWIYSFAHAQARPASFIPVVGLFAGGTDVRATNVSLTFDPAGVLQNYTSTTTNTAAGYGVSGGAYQAPDPTLPQEAR